MRDFLEALGKSYEGGYDKLMDDAEVPRTTYPGWRYKTPRGTPTGLHLLSILQTAGVLDAAAVRALDEAVRRARIAVAELAERPARDGRGRRASK